MSLKCTFFLDYTQTLFFTFLNNKSKLFQFLAWHSVFNSKLSLPPYLFLLTNKQTHNPSLSLSLFQTHTTHSHLNSQYLFAAREIRVKIKRITYLACKLTKRQQTTKCCKLYYLLWLPTFRSRLKIRFICENKIFFFKQHFVSERILSNFSFMHFFCL